MHGCAIISFAVIQYNRVVCFLNFFAESVPPLLLRLILAWEFGKAGLEKLNGTNWFADISIPFPFSLLPPDVSWSMAIFIEIAGAVALVLGLATLFFNLIDHPYYCGNRYSALAAKFNYA